VRMTLHSFHFLDAAFFPPSTRSSFLLSRPILVILRLEMAYSGAVGVAKVELDIVGVRGESARVPDSLLRGPAEICRIGA
jgi:hypothetical protein